MRLTEIKGLNMDLTDAIKDHVEKRLEGLERLCEDLQPCDVAAVVGKTTKGQQKGLIFKAEFNLNIPGTLLRVETVKEDLYEAIDVALKDLKRQLVAYKEKR
ncbi:ribosome-associated translation inhibitor RaiA [Candidatus Uhrbacteria bacterium]|jgi:putative sigma-54 modulation protein|nr:ribosome-associated translation inhibitor RaiA [Candidatus Uhrbacteria bacterium]